MGVGILQSLFLVKRCKTSKSWKHRETETKTVYQRVIYRNISYQSYGQESLNNSAECQLTLLPTVTSAPFLATLPSWLTNFFLVSYTQNQAMWAHHREIRQLCNLILRCLCMNWPVTERLGRQPWLVKDHGICLSFAWWLVGWIHSMLCSNSANELR